MSNQAYQQWRKKMLSSAKAKRIPILGQYELTPACNLDCKMCYVHSANSNKLRDNELKTEQWKRIFDEAYDCGLMFAILTGGECLMRKDFKELYLHLWKKSVRMTVMTNATMLTEEHVAFFQKYRPDLIQISLYGSSDECYEKVTGNRSFHKVVRAIQMLKDAKLPLQIAVTPSSYMGDDYIPTLKYARNTGVPVNYGQLYLFSKRDGDTCDEHYLTDDAILRYSKERTALLRELTPTVDLPKVGGPMIGAPEKGFTCGAGNSQAYVTWDGKMHPCGATLIDGASLLEMSYAQAWEKTKKVADSVVQGIECEGCAYRKVCTPCPALRLTDLHSGHCNSKVCELTLLQVAEGALRLVDQADQDAEHDEQDSEMTKENIC